MDDIKGVAQRAHRAQQRAQSVSKESFFDFVVTTLAILQILLMAAHADGLIKKWHEAYATPAGIIIAFVFIDSAIILAGFTLMSSVDALTSFVDTPASKETSKSSKTRPKSIGSWIVDHVKSRRRAIEDDMKTRLGFMRAVGKLLHYTGIIAAGTMFLVYATGHFSHAQGFSYTLVLGVAVIGRVMILFTHFLDMVSSNHDGWA
jgi:hypothetical protein